MFSLLPLISLIFIWLIIESKNQDWRDSFLSALVGWGVILTVMTESLSLLQLLRFEGLIALWLATDVLLIVAYFRHYRQKQPRARKKNKSKLSPFSAFLLIGVALIVLGIGFLAVMSAPNNPDSMRYHMSRVVQWMQNHSVAHYPTHTLKQLYQNPGSEFAILHFQILTGGDRLANLVQWGSMVGSLVGVSLIARQLGANQRGQVLATVICATIPMGMLQGASTQNDYAVAFWLVCFAYFTLLTFKEGATVTNTFRLGASLGLAVLTKGTAYVYALPFCLWLAFWGIKKLRWQAWKPFLAITLIFLAINGGHYTRNFILFNSPLGVPIASETNQAFGLSILIGNVAKQLSLHADIVRNIGVEKIIPPTIGITNKLIEILHFLLGLDPSDPRLMSAKANRFYVPALSTYEDTAGNPLHLLLIVLAAILAIANPRLRRRPYLIGYLVALSAGFLLFCFLFTWSPWRCRLHLPLFVMFSAFVGVVFSRSWNYRITSFLAVIILLLSSPWVLDNKLKPLVGKNNIFTTTRVDDYFSTKQGLQDSYVEAVKIAKSLNCSTIGLTGNKIWYEYPLWMLFAQDGEKILIQNVQVTNESAATADRFEATRSAPCAIVSVRDKIEAPEPDLVIQSDIYNPYWSKDWSSGKGEVIVYVRQ